MEKPNVNNLNGIPNFGHGLTEEEATELIEEGVEVLPTDIAIDEVDSKPETEVNEDKPTRKRKG